MKNMSSLSSNNINENIAPYTVDIKKYSNFRLLTDSSQISKIYDSMIQEDIIVINLLIIIGLIYSKQKKFQNP